MSTASHDSSTELEPAAVPLGGPVSGDGSKAVEGEIWLDGEVLACSCPDCGAPMSIRLWLMVADCFRCGTSVELSEEQEEEALRLLRRQEEAKRAESREAAAAISPTISRRPRPQPRPKPEARPSAAKPEESRASPHAPSGLAPGAAAASVAVPRRRPRRVVASEVYRGARAHIRDIYEKGGVAVFWSGLLRDLPAWLVSLVFHLVLLLLLALWFDKPRDEPLKITLSTSMSEDDLEGEQGQIEDVAVETFDLGDAGGFEQINDLEDLGADAEPDPLLPPPVNPADHLNPMGRLPSSTMQALNTTPRLPPGHMFKGRDPQVRQQAVREAGGTSATEAAVARGLVFLTRHQNKDGSWSLDRFHRSPDCDKTCTGRGRTQSDVAATALVLLSLLGAGQTHKEGKYTEEVTKGLKWLVEHQREDGDLRDGGRMYAHAQAALALTEAYALTGEEQLREPAQMALNFIVQAQHPAGGWRYEPGQEGDTSVVGWQLMALNVGQMAYLRVPTKTFELSGLFLDHVKTDKVGGHYSYQPGGRHTPAMTAEALLCRQYLGWPKDRPGLEAGVDYLLDNLPDPKNPNIYYWYYATQVMRHYGDKPWEKWNAKIRRALLSTQQKKGHAAGSWAPRGRGNHGGFADTGGRIYMTSLAVCTLEVYYRYLSIYGEEALEGFE